MAHAPRSSDIRLRHPFDPNIERTVYGGENPEDHDEEQPGRVEQIDDVDAPPGPDKRHVYIEIKISGGRMRLEVGGDCGVACGIGAMITSLRLACGS